MNTKADLIALIDEKYDDIIKHVDVRSEEDFITAHISEKWSNGQHLDHVRKATRSLNKGLEIPKLVLRFKFGSKKGQEQSYQAIKDTYYEILGQGVKAPKSVHPDALSPNDKSRVMDWLNQERNKLKGHVKKNSEKQLSKYVLPHPRLGSYSFREMILWCAMHTEHHLNLMKRDNG